MSTQVKRRLCYAIATVLLFAGLAWWSLSGPTELDRYKARLLTQGEILDIDKLAPKRTGNEPDGDLPLQNAVRQLSNSSLVLSVGQLLPNVRSNNLLSLEWLSHPRATNQTQRAPLWQQAETEIDNRRADLQLLHTAMLNPPHEKGADYRKLYAGYPRGNFVQRRSIAQLLSQAVTTDAHARRLSEATTNMLTLLDMCEHHREEWTIVDQMIRVAITGLSLETFHYGLDTQTWTEPELANFQSRIESISLVTNLYQTLLYERALGFQMFSQIRTNLKPTLTNVLGRPSVKNSIITILLDIDDDEHTFLRVTQDRIDLYRQHLTTSNWAGVPAQFRAISDTAFQDNDSWLGSYKRFFSSLMISNLEKAFQHLLKTETRRLQTITAIALERHRLKHGHHPDSLQKLIPDFLDKLPQDPMDGHPMRYRLNPDGTFTLWSVGFDGKDNGGDPTMSDPKKQNFYEDARDLVWPRLDPIDLPQ